MKSKALSRVLPRRSQASHKGDYGHILVLAGSAGLTGAAALCCLGALRSGCGLVTLGIPASLNLAMEAKLTEVMTYPLPETAKASLSLEAAPEINRLVEKADAVAIGPGLSRNEETGALVRKLIVSIDKPFVLDADGLNNIIDNVAILKDIKAQAVLTPHPGEMGRLLGIETQDVQKKRVNLATDFAREHGVTVVLKGHRTVVSDGEGNRYVNRTGNPGMASAGVGDILTGMIASLMGQGVSPFEASKLAVHVHGLAGDLAAREKGQISLIASDVLDKLPEAFKRL